MSGTSSYLTPPFVDLELLHCGDKMTMMDDNDNDHTPVILIVYVCEL